MTLIKLNDGESITVQMNFDKSKIPYSINIMRRGNVMMFREFGALDLEQSNDKIEEQQSRAENNL